MGLYGLLSAYLIPLSGWLFSVRRLHQWYIVQWNWYPWWLSRSRLPQQQNKDCHQRVYGTDECWADRGLIIFKEHPVFSFKSGPIEVLVEEKKLKSIRKKNSELVLMVLTASSFLLRANYIFISLFVRWSIKYWLTSLIYFLEGTNLYAMSVRIFINASICSLRERSRNGFGYFFLLHGIAAEFRNIQSCCQRWVLTVSCF